eukprot:s374_g45.t1
MKHKVKCHDMIRELRRSLGPLWHKTYEPLLSKGNLAFHFAKQEQAPKRGKPRVEAPKPSKPRAAELGLGALRFFNPRLGSSGCSQLVPRSQV